MQTYQLVTYRGSRRMADALCRFANAIKLDGLEYAVKGDGDDAVVFAEAPYGRGLDVRGPAHFREIAKMYGDSLDTMADMGYVSRIA